MKRFLILALCLGLLLVVDVDAKKSKKGKGNSMEEDGGADGEMAGKGGMDDQADMDDNGNVADRGEMDQGAGMSGGKSGSRNKNGKNEMCEYRFTVPSTEHCASSDAGNQLQQLVSENMEQEIQLNNLKQMIASQESRINSLESRLSSMNTHGGNMGMHQNMAQAPMKYRDCQHIAEESPDGIGSGVYEIHPWNAARPFKVYCMVDSYDNSVWTIIQKRRDGSVNFNMDWLAYKVGFGDPTNEYWVGNENLHKLTSQSKYMLRVYVTDWEQNTRLADYDGFRVDSEFKKYALYLGRYNGTAGDSLSYQNNQEFSTPDRDNDGSETTHCARSYVSGWWFNNCYHSNLNGLYHDNEREDPRGGVSWSTFKKSNMYSMKLVTMMVRRLGFI
ncbi:fibrinogen-like protein 1 [Ptychodera flava]|uniref:fibrinogen-like protein 1 n=1 Tax=Ptychodera flava TaxID=63121 RepID=UPI00396A6EEA